LNWRLSRIKHAPVDKLNLYRIDHYPIGTSRQRGSFAPTAVSGAKGRDKRPAFDTLCEDVRCRHAARERRERGGG
jgi:hypothetical protein